MDRIGMLTRVSFSTFGPGDQSTLLAIEELRGVRLGSPVGAGKKIAALAQYIPAEVMACLGKAGIELMLVINEQNVKTRNDIRFWMIQRIHLLPYFQVSDKFHAADSELIYNCCLEHPWFFYLLFSDPLI